MPTTVQEGELAPLNLIINFRKYMGLHPSYFGNAAVVQSVEGVSQKDGLTERALKVRDEQEQV